jgi:alpha-beta hydrolase superfamily lysophospholipase
MGLSSKLPKYSISLEESEHFFVHPIELMLKFYKKFTEIYMIGHSFGGYLILLYLKKYKTFVSKIKEVILLSPVGITPK